MKNYPVGNELTVLTLLWYSFFFTESSSDFRTPLGSMLSQSNFTGDSPRKNSSGVSNSAKIFNPYVMNGLYYPDHLDESTFILRGIRRIFLFFNENSVSKQNSPRWVAAFCCITSGAILLADVPIKRMPGLYGLMYTLNWQQFPLNLQMSVF